MGEELEMTEEAKKNKETVKQFCESSTIHGLSAISNSKTKFRKLFWTLSFLTAAGLCIWQVTELINKLMSHGITIQTTTVMKPELYFPVLTICNSNPYSHVKLNQIVWPEILSKMNPSKRNFSRTAKEVLLAKELGKMPPEGLRELSASLESFGLSKLEHSCTFAGKKCRQISSTTNTLLGTCFVFNNRSIVKQVRIGPNFGFSAVFNINLEDYSNVSFFEEGGVGILVRIGSDTHSNYHDLKNVAIGAAPGMVTQIKLKQKLNIRLPYPFPDNCTKRLVVESSHGLVFKVPMYYSVDICRLTCRLKWQMKFCGFVAPVYRLLVESKFDKVKSNLSFSNATGNDDLEREHECIENSASSFVYDAANMCKCPPLCRDPEYDVTVSTLAWPSLHRADTLLRDIKASWPNDSIIQNWTRESLYKNVVKIEIFFSDFNVLTTTQQKAYDDVKFLSDLGGQAGLWIGASVYSLFELFSFLICNVLKPCIHKTWKRGPVTENIKGDN